MENDLLYQIFLGDYDPTPRTSGITPREGEELQAICLQAICQKLREVLGVEEMNGGSSWNPTGPSASSTSISGRASAWGPG